MLVEEEFNPVAIADPADDGAEAELAVTAELGAWIHKCDWIDDYTHSTNTIVIPDSVISPYSCLDEYPVMATSMARIGHAA